ncbi:hypothetical protein H9P43_006908 [Blastocladiella emersonii ATCC 22665]|nr:hypothetical protein H9P43_006908 [Blastocladiella emersonii ATCC 22665]
MFAEIMCGFHTTVTTFDLTPLLSESRSLDQYKTIWEHVSTATETSIGHKLARLGTLSKTIVALHRLIVVLACVADNLAAALAKPNISLPAGTPKVQIMIAISRLPLNPWTRALHWFAAAVSPDGLTDLRYNKAVESRVTAASDSTASPHSRSSTLTDLRATLNAHPLSLFAPLLHRSRVRAQYPACAAAGSARRCAKIRPAPAAYVMAFTDPAVADRAVAATREIAAKPGLVPAVRVILEFACANVTSSAALDIACSPPALVFANSPGQEDGNGVAGLAKRVRSDTGAVHLVPGTTAMQGWDGFKERHAATFDLIANGEEVAGGLAAAEDEENPLE